MKSINALAALAVLGSASPLVIASSGNRTSIAAQAVAEIAWAVDIGENYSFSSTTDITYLTANNVDLKLDVYKAKSQTDKPRPTLMYIHGGGWMPGATKQQSDLAFLPFLQLGWTVVNVEYRPSSVSLAPAAVEDCLCALRWIGRNAKQYGIDVNRLVIMGRSAGGHLALTTGMIPLTTSGLGAPCVVRDMYGETTDIRYPPVSIKPAAIINWFGITDVADIVDDSSEHQQGYAVRWLGNQPDRAHLAKSVSPLSYVRAGLPPILTIHGTKDPLVPYDHAMRLHEALTAVKVPNKLIGVPDAGHGRFGSKAMQEIYAQIFEFLENAGLSLQAE